MAQKSKKKLYDKDYLDSLEHKELQALSKLHELPANASGVVQRKELLKIKDTSTLDPREPATRGQGEDDKSAIKEVKRTFPTKLDPPSKLPTKPSRPSFKTWSNEVSLWRRTHSEHSDAELCTMIMKALDETEKEMIFNAHTCVEVSLDSIMTCLARPYEGAEQVDRRRKLALYRACVRGKRTLQSFLADWETQRSMCMAMGLVPTVVHEQDYWDLMEAADLDGDQQASIMHEATSRESLREELGLPKVDDEAKHKGLLKALRELALSFELESSKTAKSKKQGDDGVAAMFAKGKAKGMKKGKAAGKGKEHGGKSGGCFECGAHDHWAKECPTKSKDALYAKGKVKGKKGSGKGKGGKKDRSKIICHNCQKVGHMKADCWGPGGGAAADAPPALPQ